MSRCATQRALTRLTLLRGPDVADAAETERAGGVLVEIPAPAADVGTAIIDHGVDGPPAVAEGDLGAAGQADIGHAVVGVEPTSCRPAVVVPGRQALCEHCHRAGGAAREAVGAVAGKCDAQLLATEARRR